MIIARGLASVLLLGLALTDTVQAGECSGQDASTSNIHIETSDGLLTLEARNARLVDVLDRLGSLAGFKTRRFAGLDECAAVSAKFVNQPLTKVVERLVAGSNRIIFYTPAALPEPRGTISQVWLLGPGTGVADDAGGSVELAENLDHDDALERSEAVLKLSQQVSVGLADGDDDVAVISRLGEVLQQDRDPLVRSRAAIALGALKEESAVGDLEIALRDAQSSVRAQAIGALGQIGGERASIALGGILLDQSIDAVERVMAAQALWRHDSELARGYLLLGADDAVKQVSEASREAPKTHLGEPAQIQGGPENTE